MSVLVSGPFCRGSRNDFGGDDANTASVTWGWRDMRRFILVLAALTALCVPAYAATPEEQIVESLEAQGYHVVVRDRTWLGRIWMVVENGELRREIVFNPGTGEILRDYAVVMAAAERGNSQTSKISSTASTVMGLTAASPDKSAGPVQDLVILGDPILVYPTGEE